MSVLERLHERALAAAKREQGRRVGAIKLDWQKVAEVVQELADKLEACGPEIYGSRPGRKPNHAAIKRSFTLNGRRIMIFMVPTETVRRVEADATTMRIGGELVIDINVRANPNVCIDPAKELFDTIAHEITHGLDPGIVARREKKRNRKPDGYDPAHNYCRYVNEPQEIAAYINTVRAEIMRRIEVLSPRHVSSYEDLLNESSMWRTMAHCYDEKTKKRFFRMLALNFELTKRGWRMREN
jgi:hypothetical protein